MHATWSFAGDHWVTYDLCFRQQAAATKSLNWAKIDFSLYNETFTWRAKSISRCRYSYCLSEHHRSADGSFAPQTHRFPSASSTNAQSRTELCNLFYSHRGHQCRFCPCRFLHNCSNCQKPHPTANCRQNCPPTLKQGYQLQTLTYRFSIFIFVSPPSGVTAHLWFGHCIKSCI